MCAKFRYKRINSRLIQDKLLRQRKFKEEEQASTDKVKEYLPWRISEDRNSKHSKQRARHNQPNAGPEEIAGHLVLVVIEDVYSGQLYPALVSEAFATLLLGLLTDRLPVVEENTWIH